MKRAQQLGFTLTDIEELLHLAEGGPTSCEEARTMARARIADIEQRIEELVGMRDALGRLIDTCDEPRAERVLPDPARHRNRRRHNDVRGQGVSCMRVELLTSPGCPRAPAPPRKWLPTA